MRPTSAKNHVGSKSKFRSQQRTTRIHEAHEMVRERKAEIDALRAALDVERDAKKRRTLTVRLQATTNNLRSWEKYLGDSAPREARAVMGKAA